MTSDLNISEKHESRKRLLVVVGPSGVGKTKFLAELQKQGGLTGLQSDIQYTGPTIRHTVDPEGVESWEVEGRMPRRKNKDISIWPDGIIDIHDFDLTDPYQREEAQTNIDSGVYSLANVDFAKVSDTDNEMYRFLNNVDYEKALEEARAAGLHASNEEAFGTWRSYKLPGEGEFVVECAPRALRSLYELAKEAGYSTTVVYLQASRDLLLGQMTIFREEPAGVVKDRMLATEQMNSDSSNPETPFGRTIKDIEEAGDLAVIVTTRKTFDGGEGDPNNGRPYNFERTPEGGLKLRFLDGVKDPASNGPEPRLGDPDQLHIDYILSKLAGERSPRDQGELEERILSIQKIQKENFEIKKAWIKLWTLDFFIRRMSGEKNDYVEDKRYQFTWLSMLVELHLKELKEAQERDSTTETKMRIY